MKLHILELPAGMRRSQFWGLLCLQPLRLCYNCSWTSVLHVTQLAKINILVVFVVFTGLWAPKGVMHS